MANNKIRIKRSTANATVTGLANGELAFTQASNTLHIGLPDGSGVLRIGGAQYPGVLTNSHALVANSIGSIDRVITANAVVTSLVANGSPGTNGQVLVTNGTAIYWGAGTSGSNTYVQFNDSGVTNGVAGFTFNKVSNTLFVGNAVIATSYLAGNVTTGSGGVLSNSTVITVGNNTINTRISSAGLTVNGQSIANNTGFYTSGTVNALTATIGGAANFTVNTTHIVFDGPTISAINASATVNNMTVNTNLIVTSNSTLYGNTVIGDSTNDRINVGALVSSNLIPAANVSYYMGNNTLRWAQVHAANLHATTGFFDGSVEISGDLVISGNVTTTNVNSMVVSDPMIYLAANNNAGDLLDIGFAANYFDGVTQRHTGLFRDASDSGIYKLFTGSEQELIGNNVVNTAANGWTLAILQTYIQSAGFTSNATAITITANSSLSVGIVANTLTLSTPLTGTSGGTGLNTYTQEDILVANSTNGFRKLSLGTSGYVLQSNGSALVYDFLDGGSF